MIRSDDALPPQGPQTQEKEPGTAEEFFGRGLKFLRAGVLPAAYSDFGNSNRLRENPRAVAYQAYCLGLMGQPIQGVGAGQMALNMGATGPAVRNNLGFCLTDAGQPELAIPHLEDALRQAPHMRQARYNLAVARFQVLLKRGLSPPDPACVDDIGAVLASGPASFRVLYLAATIYAANLSLGPDLRAKAIRYLVLAVRKGLHPARFAKDGVLGPCLGNDPEFRQVLRMTPGPAEPADDHWLVEPDGP
jgi:tetratricopeptide (TPR) repeat protein